MGFTNIPGSISLKLNRRSDTLREGKVIVLALLKSECDGGITHESSKPLERVIESSIEANGTLKPFIPVLAVSVRRC